MSVKVGVRVRPFNQREIDLNCKLCVDMMGPTTRLLNPDDPEKFRDFTFDYSFWSHDQFTPNEEGYFVADSEKYADQRYVFEQVGLEILSNAWEGYHCCLFAYGQTGAGKSYSMVGYGANKGIVPISCQEIFKRVHANDDPNKEYQVNVSMLQIYNEKVQDLLIPISKRSKEGYKIREHKTLGIYVEGLSKHYVDTYDSIEQKMDDGSKNRSIAATEMNASSSRAHTIISIEFRQRETIQGKKREKLSVIYLVDLAGSEKVGKTGATGDRLKEAAGINKSLSALGLVISVLAEKKGKVPYRDSCLTRLLQNALGGNSKTLMICAISPASDNYEQTLSTLRYADQAKRIQNKAVVNESETDKLIRNLTAEKDELRERVAKFEEMFKKLSMGLGMDPSQLEDYQDVKEQLRYNNMMMNDMTMTKQEKLEHESQMGQAAEVNKVDKTKPHIYNLNQDPQLSKKIFYGINEEITKVGKRGTEPLNDIELGGMAIRNIHAVISCNQEGEVFIEPIFEGEDSSCYLNGDTLLEKTELKNFDRLTFATNNMFVVQIPGGEARGEVDPKAIDWDYAQNELYLRKQMIEKEQMEEKERKIKEETEAILLKKEEELQKLQQLLKENEEARKNIEQQKEIEKAELEKELREKEAEKLRLEIENDKKKIKDQETQKKEKNKEKFYFEKKLLKTLPKCIELNLIAKEFKRNISISVKMLLPDQNEEEEEQDIDLRRRNIKIKVVNREVGYTYWWDVEKLSNRYYIIKDMSENYFETGVIPDIKEADDPFWDPPEHVLIGRAFLTTKALSYMFDNLTTLSIIGEDDHCGEITVNMIPTDEEGERNLCEEMDDEEVEFEPQELMDKPFYYNVVIEEATIPDHFENVYVEYNVKTDEKSSQNYRTNIVEEKTRNPIFNYKKLHKFDKINDILLNYLSTAKIVFKVYAHELVPKEKRESKETPQASPQISPEKYDRTPETNKSKAQSIETSPAIKSGKIESNLSFQSRAQPQTSMVSNQRQETATAQNRIDGRKQAEVSVKSKKPEPPAKKNKGKEKEECALF